MKLKGFVVAVSVITLMLLVSSSSVATRGRGEAAASQGFGVSFEVWAMDQANVGTANAGRLYIYPGVVNAGRSLIGAPDVIDLGAAAQGVGDGPGTRPHLLEFNRYQTHAVISNVASGHLYVMRMRDRRIVASIDLGLQVHHAIPTSDDQVILAAKQNDKKLGLIRTNYLIDRYTYNPAEDLDLAALQDAGHPDNAPICPIMVGRKAYVTLRGGGLYIVDTSVTPMRVLRSYTKDEVGPAGCLGVALGGKVYLDSGTPTSSNVYVFDDASNTLMKTVSLTSLGTDSHGMVLTGGGRYLWVANRGDGDNVAVIDTATDAVVGTFGGFGAAPDNMVLSPVGDLVIVTLRGPNNLTGGPSAKGATPGLAVLQVLDGGKSGQLAFFTPIGAQTPDSPNDVHGVALRIGNP